jgi:hypothetical protein
VVKINGESLAYVRIFLYLCIAIKNKTTMAKSYEPVMVYFGQGITFLEVGDINAVGDPCEHLTAEVEEINDVMEFETAELASEMAEMLCNVMGAYLIPSLYKGVVVGLDRAVEAFKINI